MKLDNINNIKNHSQHYQNCYDVILKYSYKVRIRFGLSQVKRCQYLGLNHGRIINNWMRYDENEGINKHSNNLVSYVDIFSNKIIEINHQSFIWTNNGGCSSIEGHHSAKKICAIISEKLLDLTMP